jgi:tetratricopeptide (TPR) repeat protein
MRNFSIIMGLALVAFVWTSEIDGASVQEQQKQLITFRTASHSGYLRIVMEGPEDFITKGELTRKGSDIIVCFPNESFTVEKNKLPLVYHHKKDTVLFNGVATGTVKSFTLSNPGRFVIDVYNEKESNNNSEATLTNIKKTVKGKKNQRIKLRSASHSGYVRIVMEGPEDFIVKGKLTRTGSDIVVHFPGEVFTVEKNKLHLSYQQKNDTVLFNSDSGGAVESFTLAKPGRFVIDVFHEKETNDDYSAKKIIPDIKPLIPTRVIQEEDTSLSQEKLEKVTSSRHTGSDSFIPKEFKKYWDLVKAGNGYTVLRELPALLPKEQEKRSIYYYIYGEACAAIGDQHEAIENLRLAYINAQNPELKEQALLRRSEIYLEYGLVYESKSNYRIFIDEFPASASIQKAYLGLAKSLAEIGEFRQAIQYFTKAGNEGPTLFSKANALQKLGKIKEAREIYAAAMKDDNAYIQGSDETYYLIGENMRMSGDLKEARKHFNNTPIGLYKYYAYLSLGLIDMEEGKAKEAIKNFELANLALDRKLKVLSLFNLSLAYSQAGKLDKAVKSLEEIRTNHLNSSLYKTTLLELSRLYRAEGKIDDSISLLRELVYGKQPPREAFAELEKILIDVSGKTGNKDTEGLDFVTLWNDLGKWLLDGTREEFLVRMAEKLKEEDSHFVYLSSWLAEHGKGDTRTNAALDLADYYIGLGDTETAQDYVNMVKILKGPDEATARIQAAIDYESGHFASAVKRMKTLEKFRKDDIALLGNIMNEIFFQQSEGLEDTVALYQQRLDNGTWNADAYVVLADVLHATNRKKDARTYYEIAYKLEPKNEWVIYRLGSGAEKSDALNMLGRIEKGDSIVSRAAKTKIMGMNLVSKMEEVF